MISREDVWRPRPGPPFAARPYLGPAVIGIVQIVGTIFASWHHEGARHLDAGAIVLLLAGPAALVVRRRYPAIVLAFVFAVTVGYFLLDYPRGPVFLALIVAFFTAVMRGRRLAAIVTLVVGYFSFLWLGYLTGTESRPSWAGALGLAAWLLLLATFAETARGRRERAMQFGRARAEEARRRASEERLRIARELHDVLAHNISLMNVQAGVALHLMDEQPEQARSALTAIKEASNEALTELRSVLDILRQRDEAPPRSPAPGLRDVDDLIARSEGAGLEITKRVEGMPRPLPAKTELAAFRIIQEALTNVRRHAGPAHASVVISYEPNDLTLQVDDDGSGPSVPSTGGDGIPGMRERALALGGEVEAGPRPGGGFRVGATLPLPRDEPGGHA
ncbi:MAG TPA: sensor histidine kinase [Actinomycetota bacterium]|nr:sensor histidine kinase [Actinomycetota bacterium]